MNETAERRGRARGLASILPALALALALFPLIALADPAPREEGDGDPAALVVDLHVDLPYQVHFKGRAPDLPEGHARGETLRKGAYGGVVLPIYIPDYMRGGHPGVEDADAIYATVERLVEKSPVFLPLLSPRQRPGRVGAWLSVEGAGAFAGDLAAVDRFVARGVRLWGPVHAADGPLATAATGKAAREGRTLGLTEAGKAFCERVYERGALVDVSHLSDAGFEDLVPIAARFSAPIVATHSNARAVANHPRNLTDAQLRKIGETGGVAGLNFHSPFVSGRAKADLRDVVRQLEHMVRVAGIDHVAIGSDFDGGIRPADGLEDASRLKALARYLKRRRGMTHDEVLKIFSLNALRVLGWSRGGGLR